MCDFKPVTIQIPFVPVIDHRHMVPDILGGSITRIQSVSTVKLERKLGALAADEMNQVLDALAERLRV